MKFIHPVAMETPIGEILVAALSPEGTVSLNL